MLLVEFNNEAAIDFVQRKVLGQRTARAFAIRRSRAQLEKLMTGPMLDAEREIETAFRIQAGHMGYGSSDLNRVRGMSDRDEDQEREIVRHLKIWQTECPASYRSVVMALGTDGMAMPDLIIQLGITRQTAAKRFRLGLNHWCIQRGWGNQLKKK